MDSVKQYDCARAVLRHELDGRLDKPFWDAADWTDEFIDIEGEVKPRPRYRTRAKMLWDDEALYIGAEMEEPHLWATLTERDSIIFHDNDFEVFLDPDDDALMYAELEINALNTIWDLLLPKPYRDGGPALHQWTIKGVRTAVNLRGTLNDPTDIDEGWSCEIVIPWSGIREICRCDCPPKSGDVWRINFSRVQWRLNVIDGRYEKAPSTPEDNWVWSPQGVVDMHQPEMWGRLQFLNNA